MSAAELLGVALFGAAGAMLRHHLGGYVHTAGNRALASERHFPYGTLAVNVLGCFLLGLSASLVMEEALSPTLALVFGNGFCGALSTFSTVAVDLQRYLADRRLLHALADLVLTVVAGIAALWLGQALGA